MQNVTEPINSLPNELLAQIFRMTYLDDPHFPLTASGVNRHWRAFVTESSEFWSAITVGHSKPPLHVIAMYLERSTNYPLDIHFDVGGFGNCQFAVDAMALLVQHITRWKSITVPSFDLGCFQRISQHMKGLVPSRLEHVQLFIDGYELENCHNTRLFQEAPVLQSLKVALICPLRFPISSLTILDLFTFVSDFGHLKLIFSSAPSLSTLILTRLTPGDEEHLDELSAIDASSLRRLAVSFNSQHIDQDCPCGLSWLNMPNLEYLEIGQRSYIPSLHHHLGVSRMKHYGHIRELRLLSNVPSSELPANAFPMLDCIEVGDIDDLAEYLQSATPTGITPLTVWTRLRVVKLRWYLPIDASQHRLREVLSPEVLANTPISTIYLPVTKQHISELVQELDNTVDIKLLSAMDSPLIGTDDADSQSGFGTDDGSDLDEYFDDLDFEDGSEFEEADDGLDGVELYY